MVEIEKRNSNEVNKEMKKKIKSKDDMETAKTTGPRVFPLNEKEQAIAAGARVGSRDYPTLDTNLFSDWNSEDSKNENDRKTKESMSTETTSTIH